MTVQRAIKHKFKTELCILIPAETEFITFNPLLLKFIVVMCLDDLIHVLAVELVKCCVSHR
jgi:hypothetical protein